MLVDIEELVSTAESATKEAGISALSLVMMPLPEYLDCRDDFFMQERQLGKILADLRLACLVRYGNSIPESLLARIQYMEGVCEALHDALENIEVSLRGK